MLADASLAILCGGAGKRLGGVPKGLLVLDGQTFVERLLRLRPHFADVFLVTSDPAPYARFGVRTVPDAWVGIGAPGALHTALCGSSTEWTFVTAVDMPNISAALIDELAARRSPDVDVVAADVHGRREPLGAFYRSSLREQFGARLDEGEVPSLLELHGLARVAAVAPSDPRGWSNVNTEEDLRALGASRPSAW